MFYVIISISFFSLTICNLFIDTLVWSSSVAGEC